MRFTFTLLLVWVSVVTYAQIQRGNHIITLQQPSSVLEVPPLYNALDFLKAAYYFPEKSGGVDLSPTYGYALSDRFVVGGTLIAILVSSDGYGSEGAIGLNPYLRYYAINKEKLGLYGEVTTGVGYIIDALRVATIANAGFYGFEFAVLRAGLQLPLTSGVRLGPTLDYQIYSDDRNVLTLAAQIEILLRSGGDKKVAPIGAFRNGTVMLGGQLADLRFRANFIGGSLRVGGHYFLTDRLAGGVAFGGSGLRFGSDFPYRSSVLSADLSARYYLTTERRVVWYAEAGAGFYAGRQWRSNPGGSTEESYSDVSVTAAVGGQYFLRENIALEFGPQWRKRLDEEDSGTGIDLYTGARFFLW